MKITLCMAITVNGMIATKDDEVPFVSKRAWANYVKLGRASGWLIVGRRTYEMISEGTDLKDIRDPRVIVLSRKKKFKTNSARHFLVNTTSQAVKLLKTHKAKNVLLAGGGQNNAAFLKAGLVDEMYVDVEPALVGEGIKLFEGQSFQKKLKLKGVKKFGDLVQLHYSVKK